MVYIYNSGRKLLGKELKDISKKIDCYIAHIGFSGDKKTEYYLLERLSPLSKREKRILFGIGLEEYKRD